MVEAIVIAVVFIALAVGIALAANRGRLGVVGRTLRVTSPGRSRLLNSSLGAIYVVFIFVVPLIFILGNRDTSNAQVGGIRLTAQEQVGRELFGEHCAVCHTLAADSAVGKIGPNLDTLRPGEAQVLHTLANGCLQKPPTASSPQNCFGYGTMPADIIQGQQATDVAKFVAAVAGHP
ncbi:MAG: c-type cytochrome [Solirubrobacteraceae bacterium]